MNVTTYEGLDHLNNVGLRQATQISQWYLMLFESNYQPTSADKMATFLLNATEVTDTETPSRPQISFDESTNGLISNASSPVDITLTAAKTIYGYAIVSSPTKGSSSGVLLAAGKFDTPKPRSSGEVITIIAGLDDLCS